MLTYLIPLGASFDRDTTVSWVGESYLEANAPDPTMAMDRAQFMESWKDLLPESWRCRATWDNLKVCKGISCVYRILRVYAYKNIILNALYVEGHLSLSNGLTNKLR